MIAVSQFAAGVVVALSDYFDWFSVEVKRDQVHVLCYGTETDHGGLVSETFLAVEMSAFEPFKLGALTAQEWIATSSTVLGYPVPPRPQPN